MASVRSHENITLLSYSEVTEVSGYAGNFRVKVRKKPRYVDSTKCTGCGTCQEKCPIQVTSEFEAGLARRKAIYIPFPQAVPNVPVIDPAHCTYLLKGKCGLCKRVCEAAAIDYTQKEETVEIECGNIILATGFEPFDPTPMVEFGYGRYPNVITAIQFERMSNASGPTGGKILLRDGRAPQSVAILHCVGSRDERYHKYCSRVCCMYSLKFAHLLHEKLPGCEVFQLYIDMRCAGSGYEEFYERVQREGVNFIRGRAAEVTDIAEGESERGKLIVIVEDTLIRRRRRLPVDMVVLSTALAPQADAGEVARIFSISRKADGFFLEKHPKLDPIATSTDGIFIAGCCQSPKDIPDTVAQAAAAAARVLALISRGIVETESATACIDEKRCGGCKTCLGMCPYKAITFDEPAKVARINEALCKGCGTCAAACPSGAITSRHFTAEEIMSEIEGVLL